MLCAARAEVGPLTPVVLGDAGTAQGASASPHRAPPRQPRGDDGRAAAGDRLAPGLRASLLLGECAPIESICPSGSGWGWTRKRAGMPIEGTVEAAGRRWEVAGRGVDDESAGYHQRQTSWLWSAGVGGAPTAAPLAWNLVEGINDPPERQRAGDLARRRPARAAPGLLPRPRRDRVRRRRAARVRLRVGPARNENFLLIRSRYRHRFGTFSGSLDGLALAEGFGVMEEHDAVW